MVAPEGLVSRRTRAVEKGFGIRYSVAGWIISGVCALSPRAPVPDGFQSRWIRSETNLSNTFRVMRDASFSYPLCDRYPLHALDPTEKTAPPEG